MTQPTQNDVVAIITEHYLSSGDFNGYPVRDMSDDCGLTVNEILPFVKRLIERGRITVVTSHEENPHIKRFRDPSKLKQLELLDKSDLKRVCAYPSRSNLKKVVNPRDYKGKPFALELALGEPQLAYRAFDLTVLEFYRNDPRYTYDTNDIGGHISYLHKNTTHLRKSDQTFLQSFGFAYTSKLNRAVAVFLRYLSGMTPEHQQIWNAKRLKGKYELHPDYRRTSIFGNFPEGISIFDALLRELQCVNDLCNLIGWPPLFRHEFRDDKKPREFTFLIRPTAREFSAFVHLLDKVLSDNINLEFFKNDIARVGEDGKLKGSIQMLDEWLGRNFHTPSRKPIEEMIRTFKNVRKMRQKPAHSVDEDRFDQKYFKKQRELMIEAYQAMQTLRLIFTQHPKGGAYEVPRSLREGRIWTQ